MGLYVREAEFDIQTLLFKKLESGNDDDVTQYDFLCLWPERQDILWDKKSFKECLRLSFFSFSFLKMLTLFVLFWTAKFAAACSSAKDPPCPRTSESELFFKNKKISKSVVFEPVGMTAKLTSIPGKGGKQVNHIFF